MDFKERYPNYDITTDGRVFKNGIEMKPFKSNKYLQVVLYDTEHQRKVYGVHSLVAMLYIPEYYVGCIVHHKDGNCHNNCIENLEVLSQSEHARKHSKNTHTLADYIKKNGPPNKGKKMSVAFCKKCSDSAKRRGFNGNQYVDANGARR